ncbi:helix-turn-helix domain-containing protein [Rhodocytophaga aerolata]
MIKNGLVRGLQRYQCKGCEYNRTVTHKSTAVSAPIKQQALNRYLEGLGFRAITRVLKVSHVSVYRWIKARGQQAAPVERPSTIEVVETDELHTYIGHKKTIVG